MEENIQETIFCALNVALVRHVKPLEGRAMEYTEDEGQRIGDIVISSLQSSVRIQEYADDAGIRGVLQPGYVAQTGYCA